MEFFSSGQILKQWNWTTITLIPKIVNAERVTDFRPISCCNILYKVISKILARRLEKILPDMISPNQSAFVKGRLLIENMLLASELMQGFNQKHISRRGVLKVDLRKTFDSLSWNFILQVLIEANTPETFVNWIKQCVTTTSFSINVNGSLIGFFRGTQRFKTGRSFISFSICHCLEVFANLLDSHSVQCGSNSLPPKS